METKARSNEPKHVSAAQEPPVRRKLDRKGLSKESKQGITPSLGSQHLSEKSPKLNVRLDLAGSDNTKTSRHLRWSPNDTRDMFFHKTAELFPGTVIQKVSVHLHGTSVNVQAAGPWGE